MQLGRTLRVCLTFLAHLHTVKASSRRKDPCMAPPLQVSCPDMHLESSARACRYFHMAFKRQLSICISYWESKPLCILFECLHVLCQLTLADVVAWWKFLLVVSLGALAVIKLSSAPKCHLQDKQKQRLLQLAVPSRLFFPKTCAGGASPNQSAMITVSKAAGYSFAQANMCFEILEAFPAQLFYFVSKSLMRKPFSCFYTLSVEI